MHTILRVLAAYLLGEGPLQDDARDGLDLAGSVPGGGGPGAEVPEPGLPRVPGAGDLVHLDHYGHSPLIGAIVRCGTVPGVLRHR